MLQHIGLLCNCEGKYCPSCEQWKCQRAFSKERRNSDGLTWRCKECVKNYQKKNINNINARRRENRREKADHYNAYEREYHRRNPEPKKARDRRYREENAEKRAAYNRDYRRNSEKAKQHNLTYNREYSRTHPEKNAQNFNNRRARKQQAGGSFTSQEWLELCRYYNYTCLCCGRREPEITLTIDHVVPLAKGGSNSIDNIQPICLQCNLRKGTKTQDYRS